MCLIISCIRPGPDVFIVKEDEVEDMLEKELWKPDNFKEYKTKKDAEMRVKMAESGRDNPHPPLILKDSSKSNQHW